MATITANAPTDMLNRNFYNVYSSAYNSLASKNVTFNGIFYPDIFEVLWKSGSVYYDSGFGGIDLQYFDNNGTRTITGGTATGYLELQWNGSAYLPLFLIEGISIPAVTLYNAFTTPSVADDLQITQLQLSGADIFLWKHI
jgi:hypothetical protein